MSLLGFRNLDKGWLAGAVAESPHPLYTLPNLMHTEGGHLVHFFF